MSSYVTFDELDQLRRRVEALEERLDGLDRDEMDGDQILLVQTPNTDTLYTLPQTLTCKIVQLAGTPTPGESLTVTDTGSTVDVTVMASYLPPETLLPAFTVQNRPSVGTIWWSFYGFY